MWDVATGTTTRRLSGHMGKIHAVEFNEDASVIASGTISFHEPCPVIKTRSRLVRLHRSSVGPEVSRLLLFEFPHNSRLTNVGRAQSHKPIQTLEEARDTVQTLYVGPTFIITGSVDGHVRTYDLRKGEMRSDFLGREFVIFRPWLFSSS